MNTTKTIVLSSGAALIIGLLVILAIMPRQQALGSVSAASEYKSLVTSIAQTNTNFKQSGLVKAGVGALGSVIITGAGANVITIYDASTTDATKRAANLATSSLPILASFPTNAAAGTYTFDVSFYNGLVLDFSGTQGTTTVTYR